MSPDPYVRVVTTLGPVEVPQHVMDRLTTLGNQTNRTPEEVAATVLEHALRKGLPGVFASLQATRR